MTKSKKYLSLLIIPFLFSCEQRNESSSNSLVSNEPPSGNSSSSEKNQIDLFSSFLEKCQTNIGAFEIRSSDYDFPISTYSFYGEKVQLQQYSDDFKDYYESNYGVSPTDGGIIINGEQGAYSYHIENGQLVLENPVGYASTLLDLKSYGPVLLGDKNLYQKTTVPNQYVSIANEDGTLKIAPYYTAIAGISSEYQKYMDSFTLTLDESLENIVASMHFKMNESEITYTATLTHLGDDSFLPPEPISSYLSSPKMVEIPSTWNEESKSYIHSNLPFENLLPFPKGITAQYSESSSSSGIFIINYGVNLVSSYKNQLLEAGFKKEISLSFGTTQCTLTLSAEESDNSFLSSKATVAMKYASNATMIVIGLDTDYKNFVMANEELSLWNNGEYNKEQSLDLRYASLPDSSSVTRVHSYNLTETFKEQISASGYQNDILYYWLAEADISTKEDAISYANTLFQAQKEAGFFMDTKTTLEKDGYAYIYKINSGKRTEAALRVSLHRDDLGEYGGTIVLEVVVGNYVLLDSMLEQSPYGN